MLWGLYKRKDEVESKELEGIVGKPEKEKNWYGLHVLPEIPGMEIVEALGIVHVYNDPHHMFKYKLKEDDFGKVLLKLKEKALDVGANAVVNVKVIVPADGGLADGSGTISSEIYVYGEAVVVRPKF